jgi:hypothetical protein
MSYLVYKKDEEKNNYGARPKRKKYYKARTS